MLAPSVSAALMKSRGTPDDVVFVRRRPDPRRYAQIRSRTSTFLSLLPAKAVEESCARHRRRGLDVDQEALEPHGPGAGSARDDCRRWRWWWPAEAGEHADT